MSNIVCARMTREDILLLKRVCQARGENLSSFFRRALRTELGKLSYLSQDEKKALGIKEGRE